ncbi:MAG: protein translocase subunit SecF [Acidobacteria bacterium]|nr:protein translocase subunit SecF [Acidobacteriota bacterium]MBI3657515.1 protein translocase subunit SecF [Acidobacteriota bacterium]
MVLIFAGLASLSIKKGPRLGIDFTGGTMVYVKFQKEPDLNRIRAALGNASIQQFDTADKHEVQIRLEHVPSAHEQVSGSEEVLKELRGAFDADKVNSPLADLNNMAGADLPAKLRTVDPLGLKPGKKSEEDQVKTYNDIANRILKGRETLGIFHDFNEVRRAAPELTDAAMAALSQVFYLGSFRSIAVESVGPVVGKDLQQRAFNAVTYSVLAMLVYIGWRFKQKNFLVDGLIYGMGAVIALVHDVLITVGLFSITGKEISLTVIAALLTLIGYSVNDTIVVFDRIRENLKVMRKESLSNIINKSINQTLSRTLLTSFTVFISVGCLLIFGGEVLSGFSFALTVGIIIGTYSSIAIAAPILVFWENLLERRRVRA